MLQREIDPALAADIEKFDVQLQRYLAGDLDEDVFRVFRLTNGIYGQRQGGHHQMLRVKVPYGSLTPDQIDMFAHISDEYSRGWGHITTRQNLQFHFVPLERVPAAMRDLASVGPHHPRGLRRHRPQRAGLPPRRRLPLRGARHQRRGPRRRYRHFLHNPLGQRLPRKFKINFSGCATDCGQAMFNDVGVIATTRRHEDGTVEPGFRVFVAGGLGANPHPALALEEFTPREELLPTIEACLRVFDHNGNRENKLRARMKWLVDTLGWEEVQRQVLKERKFLVASSTWPGGIPDEVEKFGDEPAGTAKGVVPTPVGQGIEHTVPVSIIGRDAYARWEAANVVRGVAKGTVSAYAWSKLGDITSDQFRALASIQRELGAEVRVTNRQNFVFRGLSEAQLPHALRRASTRSAWPSPAPS